MTSKNLFFKLVKQDFKKRVWCPILVFIAYFLSLEVRLLMETDKFLKNPGRYHYGSGVYEIATYVREYFFGRDAAMMAVVTCAAAFLCGISGYGYLHSRTQLDTYHSLPVSRIQLFWSKYVSGIVQFFLPFVIHVLICAGIAAGRDAFFMETVPALLCYISLHLVVFAVTYAVTVLAVVLTGNIIVSILGTVILFAYSTVLDMLAGLLSDRFFETYVTYGKRINVVGISEKIWCFSPLSMILRLFSRPDNRTMEAAEKLYKYDASYVWVLITAAVVYSLAACLLYRRRASEAAGSSIVFGAAEPVIKTMVVIPVSFFAAIFFSEISPNVSLDSWFLFGLVFGFVACSVLTETIFRLDIRGALMHKKQFLFNGTCTALIFVVLRYDMLGYDTYVPADSQMRSCAVSIQELIPLNQRADVSEFGYHYLYSDDYRMANMALQGNPGVTELARKAAKEQLSYRYFDYYEGIEEDPEYIETQNRQERYTQVCFGYRLLNGQTIYRKYYIDLADADTVRLLSDIFDDCNYKLGSTPLFNENWDITLDSVRCENNFRVAVIGLTPKMQAKLTETYQKEYTKLTLDTVMNVVPVGTIDFMRRCEHTNISYSDELVVYPQFVETIALLREYGFDMEEKLTADSVESVIIRDDTDYNTDEDGIDMAEYTDKEQIQQLLDNLVNDGITSQVLSFADYLDRQYDVEVVFNIDDSAYYHYRFFKGKVPEFVKLSKKIINK